MQITRETDYAIRCVLHLARQPRRVAPAAEIAAATQVPRIFLAKILQRLAKAGIVVSQRGVQGGFSLARDLARHTFQQLAQREKRGETMRKGGRACPSTPTTRKR